MRTRVVVVDDDEVMRRGMASVLDDHPEIEVVAAVNHDEGLLYREWDGADVAVVDAGDERRLDDQFPGVGVVEAIRHVRDHDETLVIVLTGYFFNDGLRRRMREAQADFFYHRTELHFASVLHRAVLQPGRSARGVPEVADREAAFRHGVTDYSRVNRAVEFAVSSALPERLRPGPSRSRGQERLRREFNRVARLEVRNADGTLPERQQDSPSKSQIQRFLLWATQDLRSSSQQR